MNPLFVAVPLFATAAWMSWRKLHRAPDLALSPQERKRRQALLSMGTGIGYAWGAGGPSTPWPRGGVNSKGERGYDCSGLAQSASVAIGTLSSSAPDRNADGLYKAAKIVKTPVVGDLAFYGGWGKADHVGIVYDDTPGQVTILEARNSKFTSSIQPAARDGFLGFGRLV